MAALRCDVAVIGGGPAGCVFAIRMTQLGFDVCLVERSRFPRSHLGESLSAGVMPMLASIDCASAIEALGAPRVSRVRTNWDGPFTDRVDPREEGMLVDRGAFDSALLRRAAAIGVRVLQPAQLRAHTRVDDAWMLDVDADGERLGLRASFVADATGRSRRLGGTTRAMGRHTVALYGYWSGDELPTQPRIEATHDGWYWGVPIPDGSYNTLVFVDADTARGDRSQSLDDRLRELLGRSRLMEQTSNVALRAPARAADATARLNTGSVSEHHISIGDAALSIDPLSSSGVQKAIQSALSGAIVANTLLRMPARTDSAVRFHRSSLAHAAERHRAWAAQYYAGPAARYDTDFWRARAGAARSLSEGQPSTDMPAPDALVELAPDATLRNEPCLGSHFVEDRVALVAPMLDGPVAYLGGHELGPLLQHVSAGVTLRELVERWSTTMPVRTGAAVARWLVEHRVLRVASNAILGP